MQTQFSPYDHVCFIIIWPTYLKKNYLYLFRKDFEIFFSCNYMFVH